MGNHIKHSCGDLQPVEDHYSTHRCPTTSETGHSKGTQGTFLCWYLPGLFVFGVSVQLNLDLLSPLQD